MTVRFDAGADNLTRTSNLVDYTGSNTIMGWSYMSVDTNGQTVIFSINDGGLSDFDLIGHDTNGTQLRLGSRTGNGVPLFTLGTNVTVGVWNHVAMRRTGTSIALVLNGVVDITHTLSGAARPASANLTVANQVGVTTVPFNGRVQDVKEYSVALTDAEIVTEMFARRPIRLANLVNFTPILAGSTGRTRAYIGVDWTEGGTLTDEDPAPVGWGNSVMTSGLVATVAPTGRIMSSLANHGGLAYRGGLAGIGGGLAG